LSNMTSGSADSEEFDHNLCTRPHYFLFIILGVFTSISLCGLVGNVVVVWLLGFHMKQNPFTVYVLNLAIADFSLLLVLLAGFIILMTSGQYCNLTDGLSLTIGFMALLFLFCYLAGMYLLTAMSVERCLAVW
ncbi:MAS protein, partial [Indicator maculatus]|nr:MAS protein [Indicator maculatus]